MPWRPAARRAGDCGRLAGRACSRHHGRPARPCTRWYRARGQRGAGFYLEPEEHLHRLLLNLGQHLLEQVIPLPLVLDQRADLGIGAQPNPFTQRLHGIQVVDPLPVDGLQEHQPFYLAELFYADLLLFAFVRSQRRGLQPLLDVLAAGILCDRDVGQRRNQPRRELPQPLQIPLLGPGIGGTVGIHQSPQQPFDHVQHVLAYVVAEQGFAPLSVDDLALHVQDVIVFQHVLADVEVILLDFLLSVLDLPGHQPVLDRRVLVDAQPVHDRRHALAGKQPHQLVVQAHIEAGGPGVALPAGTTAELVVDPAGFMALSADDMQPTERADLVPLRLIRRVASQEDVHAPPGHVRRDRHRAQPASLGDDLRLAFVLLGVEDLVGHAAPAEHLAQLLVLFDAPRPHQHRPAASVPLLNLRHHRAELGPFGFVDEVGRVLADHRLVRGDDHDGEIVYFLELFFLCLGRAGHPGQLGIHAEVVLNGDGGQGLALTLDADVLFRLNRLMQPVGVPAAQHQPSGELVHDDDLAVLDHVIHVVLVAGVRPQRLLEVMHEIHVLDVGQILDTQRSLGACHPLLGQRCRLEFLVHGVIAGSDQALDQSGKVVVLLG